MIKITLKVPLKYGSETITELELKAPVARDFRDMPLEPKYGDLMDVAAKLCNQPPSVIDQLSPVDMSEVLLKVGEFMGTGPKTGKKG